MQIDKRHIAGCLISVALLGCGSTSDIDATAAHIAQTVCTKAYQCCTTMQLMNNDGAGTDEPSCESKTSSNFRGELQAIQHSQDAGRARYESDRVDACLANIQTMACGDLNMTNHLTGVPGCDTFVTPLVAVGGACSANYECIDGWCQVPQSSSGDGTCQPNAQSGQSCAASNCEAGLTCDPNGEVCVQPGANDATCTDDFQCQSNFCALPSSGSGGSGTCATPTASNGSCFYSSGCSAAGAGGRPSLATLSLLAGLLMLALARRRSAYKLGAGGHDGRKGEGEGEQRAE
jgi:hypothetical protein